MDKIKSKIKLKSIRMPSLRKIGIKKNGGSSKILNQSIHLKSMKTVTLTKFQQDKRKRMVKDRYFPAEMKK